MRRRLFETYGTPAAHKHGRKGVMHAAILCWIRHLTGGPGGANLGQWCFARMPADVSLAALSHRQIDLTMRLLDAPQPCRWLARGLDPEVDGPYWWRTSRKLLHTSLASPPLRCFPSSTLYGRRRVRRESEHQSGMGGGYDDSWPGITASLTTQQQSSAARRRADAHNLPRWIIRSPKAVSAPS